MIDGELGLGSGGGEGGMERSTGLYSTSSGAREFLSVEKGVFNSGNGRRWSRCLEIRLNRCCVDLFASFPIAAGLPRGQLGELSDLVGITLGDLLVNSLNSRGKLV